MKKKRLLIIGNAPINDFIEDLAQKYLMKEKSTLCPTPNRV